MKKGIFLSVLFLSIFSYSLAEGVSFSPRVSKDSLRTLKRMEYKEGIPNGMLHAISLVETNIGQTGQYRPWPYTIRLNSYKSEVFTNIDDAFDELDLLVDLGFQNFDLLLGEENIYGLSSFNLEDMLNRIDVDSQTIQISARGIIKYFKDKKEAEVALDKLISRQWYDFKVGIMQLNYSVVKSNTDNVYDALNTYENIDIMVKQLKEIRRKHTWWESVGLYHSKQQTKAKRYVKNVWAMYQRVHKIKVR
jgi:hypothetical protein